MEIETENAAEQVSSEPVKALDDVIRAGEAKILAAAESPLKRKRGRPRKVIPEQLDGQVSPELQGAAAGIPAAPIAPPPDYSGLIAVIAMFGSGYLVRRFGPEAGLTEEEREQLKAGLNPAFQKWFPEFGEASEEMAAGACLVGVGVQVFQRIEAAERERAEQSKAS